VAKEKEMKCPECGSHKLSMKGYCLLCGYESKCWECQKHINRFNLDTVHKKCGKAIAERYHNAVY
jgi:hypothetical protein